MNTVPESLECNVSPVRGNIKHEATPYKGKKKLSKREQGVDVHTTCSTPNAHHSKFVNSLNSPSGSFPYSQDNLPDVVWDYTSPKLPKGSKKREIKITVDEFMKNLTQHKVPECHTQASHYIKLLEDWMAKKQNSVTTLKEPNKVIHKPPRKGSRRRLVEEIKKFIETIEVKNKENDEVTDQRDKIIKEELVQEMDAINECRNSDDKRKLLNKDSNECDSIEELWGEGDSFIVKATQELEVFNPVSASIGNQNLEVLSTIPETNLSDFANYAVHVTEQPQVPEQSNSDPKTNSYPENFDSHAAFLLTQLVNADWDSESENEWDNGFLAEDDALSLIPDEILSGKDSTTESCVTSVSSKSTGDKTNPNIEHLSSKINSSGLVEKTLKENGDYAMSCDKNNKSIIEMFETNSGELFNIDESFGDESLLCQPEVLSWIDEVESKLSQSQKCTPEEIEKKKHEAIKRRKEKQHLP